MPVKGEPGIESSGLWDDPGFMAWPPYCSSLSSSSPVVGLAQVPLSRPWHRESPWPKRIWSEGEGSLLMLRGFSSIKHHLLPIMRYPKSSLCLQNRQGRTYQARGLLYKYTLKLAQRNQLSILHHHTFQNTSVCIQQSLWAQSHNLRDVWDVITAFIF